MRIEAVGEIDAPLDRVWAWWTDFGKEGDVFRMAHGLGASTRTILHVEPGRVVLEDRSLLGKVRREVRIGDRALHETASGGQAFESEWRFEDAGSGRTRVVRTVRLRAHAAFGPFARAVTRADLRHHCRAAERELKA